ncbi:AbrB/MazE/SpoVT family DNA-binding domain-containing protein [Paenibacillus sp. CN-4]|uniref:AbrB/MazE/SpoVT family DNA-binding domain-containing protein n=1 Tax=Paenibacillus nanchangensis TaxID=3348343 RepID=UPI00397CE10D
MKDTGMIRSLDSLGRIVVPAEIRMTRNIEVGDPIEFFILNDNIIVLRKYTSTECTFCRSLDRVTYYRDQFICSSCLGELASPSREPEPSDRPYMPAPEAASAVYEGSGRKKARSEEMRQRLEQAVQQYPAASQKELARILGISQARVSQLKRKF